MDELEEYVVGATVQVEQVPVKVEGETVELTGDEQVEQVGVGISVLPVQAVVSDPAVDDTGLIFSEKLVVTDEIEATVFVELDKLELLEEVGTELQLAVGDDTELELIAEVITELVSNEAELELIAAVEVELKLELVDVGADERDELLEEIKVEEEGIILLLREILLVMVDDGVRIFEVNVGKLAELILVKEVIEVEEEASMFELDEEDIEEELIFALEVATKELIVEEVVEGLGLSTMTSTQLQNLSDLVSIVH